MDIRIADVALKTDRHRSLADHYRDLGECVLHQIGTGE